LPGAGRETPQDIHVRPAVRDQIRSVLLSSRTSPDLRGLALRRSAPDLHPRVIF